MSQQMKPFSSRNMYILGNGNEDKCHFDFSILPMEHYEGFFAGLPNFLYKKCKNVTFSNDFYYNYKRDGRHSKRREAIISESVMYRHPSYLQYLVKIIKSVVPKSKKIETLSFSNIKISRTLVKDICVSIASNPNIVNIKFADVPLRDRGVKEVFSILSPYQIKNITLVNTGLTAEVMPMIDEFLSKQPRSMMIDHVIEEINIEQEDFPEEDKEEIKQKIINSKERDDDWDTGAQWESRLNPQTDIYDSVLPKFNEGKTNHQEDIEAARRYYQEPEISDNDDEKEKPAEKLPVPNDSDIEESESEKKQSDLYSTKTESEKKLEDEKVNEEEDQKEKSASEKIYSDTYSKSESEKDEKAAKEEENKSYSEDKKVDNEEESSEEYKKSSTGSANFSDEINVVEEVEKNTEGEVKSESN